MDGIFLWLIGGFAGLLIVAGLVAGWEQLRRIVRPHEEFTSAAPRTVKVDVRLDRLTALPAQPATPAAAAPGDLDQRRAALDEALARMAQPLLPAADGTEGHHWADTTPMVGPGSLAIETAPDGSATR